MTTKIAINQSLCVIKKESPVIYEKKNFPVAVYVKKSLRIIFFVNKTTAFILVSKYISPNPKAYPLTIYKKKQKDFVLIILLYGAKKKSVYDIFLQKTKDIMFIIEKSFSFVTFDKLVNFNYRKLFKRYKLTKSKSHIVLIKLLIYLICKHFKFKKKYRNKWKYLARIITYIWPSTGLTLYIPKYIMLTVFLRILWTYFCEVFYIEYFKWKGNSYSSYEQTCNRTDIKKMLLSLTKSKKNTYQLKQYHICCPTEKRPLDYTIQINLSECETILDVVMEYIGNFIYQHLEDIQSVLAQILFSMPERLLPTFKNLFYTDMDSIGLIKQVFN
jgi:hypothetical protein